MRVLHLIFSFGVGGAEYLVRDLINEQSGLHQATLIVVNRQYELAMLDGLVGKVAKYLIDRPVSSKNPFYLMKLWVVLLWLRPDVIHCHNERLILLVPPWLRKRCLLTVHDTVFDRNFVRRFHCLVAISSCVRERLIHSGVPASAVVRVFNAVSSSDIKTGGNLGFSISRGASINVVSVARLVPSKKGQDILLRALKICREAGLDMKLHMYGDGPGRSELVQLASELGVEGAVNMHGAAAREYLRANLQSYDIFVHPARFEGFGLVVLEAIFSGLPVLVSDVDGPMEIINNGQYGAHFKSGSFESLADALMLIVRDSESSIARSKLALAYAKRSFSLEVMSSEYSGVYEAVSSGVFVDERRRGEA